MRGGDQRRKRESWKTTLGSQGPGRFTLSHGKIKKGDDVSDDEDDALRNSVPQDRVTAMLCTEECSSRLTEKYI